MKFLLLCTLFLGLAFFMASALPHTNDNMAPMVDHDQHHHQVVRSVNPIAGGSLNPPQQEDVACCG
ncbi:uncharacterized protein LOC108114355 [Drosophila eugracilis]|uniref:uncharacterized protein LOC108114355 n=1 Tax=Drosophila eugracilis TaxID=29029 RepID=UPI0007E6CBC4|nr:uncharacterized protein LOC108114355 [Drosophila eugracilis]